MEKVLACLSFSTIVNSQNPNGDSKMMVLCLDEVLFYVVFLTGTCKSVWKYVSCRFSTF